MILDDLDGVISDIEAGCANQVSANTLGRVANEIERMQSLQKERDMTNEIDRSKVDWSKATKTVDGRKVRIYATDAGGEYPIHGGLICQDGVWGIHSWNKNGRKTDKESVTFGLDLAPPTIRVEGWLNVYPESLGSVHRTRGEADKSAERDRIACIHIEHDVTPGEGLGE